MLGPMTPFLAFERLFFAVFGQTTTLDINPMRHLRPEWTEVLFKFVFGIYLLVSVVVLINLLIAMMSDTYQRIQVCIAKVTNLYFLSAFPLPPIFIFLFRNAICLCFNCVTTTPN